MPSYLLRVTGPDGKATDERVDAPSAAAAVEAMRARGFTGVELITSELDVAITQNQLAHMKRSGVTSTPDGPARHESFARQYGRLLLRWATVPVVVFVVRRFIGAELSWLWDGALAAIVALVSVPPLVARARRRRSRRWSRVRARRRRCPLNSDAPTRGKRGAVRTHPAGRRAERARAQVTRRRGGRATGEGALTARRRRARRRRRRRARRAP